jgi:hypothetical protein
VLVYPWDEISIYGFSLCIVVPFILEMLALHYITPTEKKIWSHAALLFTYSMQFLLQPIMLFNWQR